MRTPPVVWILRIVWLVTPFTAAEPIARALDQAADSHVTAVRLVIGAQSWLIWGIILVAAWTVTTISLTALRLAMPAAVALTLIAALVAANDADGLSALTVLGILAVIVSAGCVVSAPFINAYVNGSSYGDERRFSLRTPIGFLIAPVPVLWTASVGFWLLASLLGASGRWWPALPLAVISLVAAKPAVVAFHGLSRRWLVFVPAGVTLVDHLALADPVLIPKRQTASFGPALEDTEALDLTSHALGLALEIATNSPLEISRRTGRADAEIQLVAALLVSPVQPGAVLAEAQRRGITRSVV